MLSGADCDVTVADLGLERAMLDVFMRKYLKDGVQPDGRELKDFAEASVTVGCLSNALGSSSVAMGDTKFECGVTAQVAPLNAVSVASDSHPLLRRHVILNVDLPPVCHPSQRPGPPSDLTQTLTQQVSDWLAEFECVRYDSLAVGRHHTLLLHIDAVCVSLDGCPLDCCLLAIMAALGNCRLPKVTVCEATGGLLRGVPGEMGAVLNKRVLCSSFLLLSAADGAVVSLAGPCATAESAPRLLGLQNASILHMLSVGDSPDRVVVVASGGMSLTRDIVGQAKEAAVERHRQLLTLLT